MRYLYPWLLLLLGNGAAVYADSLRIETLHYEGKEFAVLLIQPLSTDLRNQSSFEREWVEGTQDFLASQYKEREVVGRNSEALEQMQVKESPFDGRSSLLSLCHIRRTSNGLMKPLNVKDIVATVRVAYGTQSRPYLPLQERLNDFSFRGPGTAEVKNLAVARESNLFPVLYHFLHSWLLNDENYSKIKGRRGMPLSKILLETDANRQGRLYKRLGFRRIRIYDPDPDFRENTTEVMELNAEDLEEVRFRVFSRLDPKKVLAFQNSVKPIPKPVLHKIKHPIQSCGFNLLAPFQLGP